MIFIIANDNNNIVSCYVPSHGLCIVLSFSHVILIQLSKMDAIIVAVW